MSDYSWDGPSVGAFDDAANWIYGDTSTHGVPGPKDSAGIMGTAKKKITVKGNGHVGAIFLDDVTIAGSIIAGATDLTGKIAVDTGASFDTGNVLLNYASAVSVGGIVDTTGHVLENFTSPVTIGVSTGEAQAMVWSVSTFFEDEEGKLTVEHGGAVLKVDVLGHSDGIDLFTSKAQLIVTAEGAVDTSGILATQGARVVLTDFAHVQATGSHFNDPNSPFGGAVSSGGGLVSADFEGPTTIDNAAFDGLGSIQIGYLSLGDTKNVSSVHAYGNADVSDSYTLLADGKLTLGGSAKWDSDGAVSKKAPTNGSVQVGEEGGFRGSLAVLSIADTASLKARALAINPNGELRMTSKTHVLLGSGVAKAGVVVVGAGGTLSLDGVSGSYQAATDIDGGAVDIMAAKASGRLAMSFGSKGGALDVSKGAAITNAISGFGTRASIDFLGVATTTATFKNDVLTLKDKGKVVETARFASGEHLKVGSDGKGGTKVTYGGGAGVTVIKPAAALDVVAENREPGGAASAHHWLELLGATHSAAEAQSALGTPAPSDRLVESALAGSLLPAP